MAATDERTILVTGATGKQGGAVARELLKRKFRVRGMTRKPDGESARALAALGAEIVKGDLDDAASLERALEGAWGVWALQNTWEAGVVREEEQGKRLAKVARDRGVRHYVYSSVGSAHRGTGIPHFENKWRVEETVRSLGFPSHVILRPVFFMENLVSPWFLHGDKLMTSMKPDTKLQMIAVEDVGRFGAIAFEQAAELNRAEIDLAGDVATMPEVVAVLGEAMGRRIEFVRIPIEEVRRNSEDFALMLEWFDRAGYEADIAGLSRRFGFTPLSLAGWAAKHARR